MAGETTTESNGNGKKADFLDECEQYLGSRNLYELLGLERTADEAAIKSAYRKKSLKVHPDRAPEDRKEHAKRAFQTLTKVRRRRIWRSFRNSHLFLLLLRFTSF